MNITSTFSKIPNILNKVDIRIGITSTLDNHVYQGTLNHSQSQPEFLENQQYFINSSNFLPIAITVMPQPYIAT